MTQIQFLGPRGLFKTESSNEYLTQIIMRLRLPDGTVKRYVLRRNGQWFEYPRGYVFGPDDNFYIPIEKVGKQLD